jgi:hypothetical protein
VIRVGAAVAIGERRSQLVAHELADEIAKRVGRVGGHEW